MPSSASRKPSSPVSRLPADEREWLGDLTSVITSITRTTHATTLYDAMGARAGLSLRPYLFGVLSRIKDLQPVRVSDVAEQLDYDRSTVSRHVAELASMGCVEREADAADGRAVILRLTPAGEDAVAKVFESWMAFLHDVTAGWSAADRKRFLTLLVRFDRDLDEAVTSL